jgi:hypothetical protein
MPFPKKFKNLLETKRGQIEEPTSAWITYAVCGVEKDSCGWGGWILESAKGASGELPSFTDQICPSCGKETFRTKVSIKFEPSKDQTRDLIEGRDYDVVPMQYE